MVKRLELWGRRLLVWLLGHLWGVRARPVELGAAPRILVVRLDERVGNVLLLTPLLSSLRQRFPQAQVDVLGYARGAALLAAHPAVSTFVPFDKRRLFSPRGPLRTPLALRAVGYDVAIDASNPTDPSFTQAFLVRMSGAQHTVGAAHGAFAKWFSAPAQVSGEHEIDLRLCLLAPLGVTNLVRSTSVAPPPAPGGAVAGLLRDVGALSVLNVGARLTTKLLAVEDYARIAAASRSAGLSCVVTYGPAEEDLARRVVAAAPGSVLAPPTNLTELAQLMRQARAVVSCDTGPMHLAVALGVPTCGIFVSTDPRRYGYDAAPHRALDLRSSTSVDLAAEVTRWLGANVGPAPSR